VSAAFLKINCWDDIPQAIARLQAAGPGHRVPLMQALYRGRIALHGTHDSAICEAIQAVLALVGRTRADRVQPAAPGVECPLFSRIDGRLVPDEFLSVKIALALLVAREA